jgi:hypothetical protein
MCANQDFAGCMRDLAAVDSPDADKICVVMDNLSTHTASAIYQTFSAVEARRILRRLEFHYTPGARHLPSGTQFRHDILCHPPDRPRPG